MGAIHKQNLLVFTSKLFWIFFFLWPAVPEKAKISTDYQRIALFQLAQAGVLKARHLPVHISCDIKQRVSLLSQLPNG